MTITLPRWIELFGIFGCGVVGAIIVYAIVGAVAVLRMDSGPEWFLSLPIPAGIVGFALGVWFAIGVLL